MDNLFSLLPHFVDILADYEQYTAQPNSDYEKIPKKNTDGDYESNTLYQTPTTNTKPKDTDYEKKQATPAKTPDTANYPQAKTPNQQAPPAVPAAPTQSQPTPEDIPQASQGQPYAATQQETQKTVKETTQYETTAEEPVYDDVAEDGEGEKF